jgi:hypothetical protein
LILTSTDRPMTWLSLLSASSSTLKLLRLDRLAPSELHQSDEQQQLNIEAI